MAFIVHKMVIEPMWYFNEQRTRKITLEMVGFYAHGCWVMMMWWKCYFSCRSLSFLLSVFTEELLSQLVCELQILQAAYGRETSQLHQNTLIWMKSYYYKGNICQHYMCDRIDNRMFVVKWCKETQIVYFFWCRQWRNLLINFENVGGG